MNNPNNTSNNGLQSGLHLPDKPPEIVRSAKPPEAVRSAKPPAAAPSTATPSNPTAVPTPNGSTTAGKKFRLLMAEDDQFIRDLYSREVIKIGFDVTIVTDGQAAIDTAFAGEFDIFMFDVMMPKATGLDAVKAVKANDKTKNIPVFMLTNLGQEGVIKEAFKMGIAGYFLKTSKLPKDVAEHLFQFMHSGEIPPEATTL